MNLLYLLCPERGGPSREFGYLARSSARTRMTSAVMNRQSMAIITATRIQDDFSSNRPHLLCVGTARRSFSAACGPTAQSSGPTFRHRFPHTQKKRDQFISGILVGSVRAVTRVGRGRSHLQSRGHFAIINGYAQGNPCAVNCTTAFGVLAGRAAF